MILATKFLDHSSISTLMADLTYYRNGVFHFQFESDSSMTKSWRLHDVFPFRLSSFAPLDAVRLRVEFSYGPDNYHLWLDGDGWLVTVQRPSAGAKWRKMTGLSRMRAIFEGGGPSSPIDNFQHDLLDKNLQGIFA